MAASCIMSVPNDNFVTLKKSYLDICGGDRDAAILLSYFEGWHNFKLRERGKNIKSNDISEMHGDERHLPEHLLQFHTTEDIYSGCLGEVSRKGIVSGRQRLCELGFLSEHKNPNPKYTFDKTVHFRLYPPAINAALKQFLDGVEYSEPIGQNDQFDMVETTQSNQSERLNRRVETTQAIQHIHSNIQNTNTPPNPQRGNRVPENFVLPKQKKESKQAAPPPDESPAETTYGDDKNYHLPRMMEELVKVDPSYKTRLDPSEDYPACRQIAYKILGGKEPTLVSWNVLAPKWADFLKRRQSHVFYSKRALRVCKSHLQEIMYDVPAAAPPKKVSWDVQPTNSEPIKW